MIIDSLQYNGICRCGKEHRMETEFAMIESGCLKNLSGYLSKYGIQGYTVAVYDENTYAATADRHPSVDLDIILDPTDLHANEHGVSLLMEKLPSCAEVLIAIGSGTIHDITRYCAYTKKAEFVSCPTAASVDGFCSSVAAMTWNGFKKTFTAVAPKIVVADLNVISKAPMFLTKSGFGDMIGKFIALADWKIAHTLTGEYFCPIIHDITLNATQAVIESAESIKNGDIIAYEKLTYGLLMSGLAMQLLGNSRCASGAEHHISHLIEMHPDELNLKSDALHGEKVGVGTLLAAAEYHAIKNNSSIRWTQYPDIDNKTIKAIFGEKLWESILAENSINCASGISEKRLCVHWKEICKIIDTIPTYDDLLCKYKMIGAKASLSDINVDEDKLSVLLEYSPLVRNRLTLMRLRKCIV